MERAAARISRTGQAWILEETFLPYDLYLEEEGSDWDVDVRQNNLDNFYYWCASRVLSLDRKYAKEILNSIGAAQAVTDRDRAEISLSYHCVSLTDVFWVRKMGENTTFAQINLYDHTLNEALVEISLRGRQMTVTNQELAQDLSVLCDSAGGLSSVLLPGTAGYKEPPGNIKKVFYGIQNVL